MGTTTGVCWKYETQFYWCVKVAEKNGLSLFTADLNVQGSAGEICAFHPVKTNKLIVVSIIWSCVITADLCVPSNICCPQFACSGNGRFFGTMPLPQVIPGELIVAPRCRVLASTILLPKKNAKRRCVSVYCDTCAV